jgi:PD-(D/E)XK nuclease superfamily
MWARAVSTAAFLPALPAALVPASRRAPSPSRRGARAARWRAASTPAGAAPGPVRLAPSDFAFLWEECRRCFYLKAQKQLYRPRAPFPSIFSAIDLAMKRHLRGLRTTDVLPEMKPGVFLCEDDDAWVECAPIVPPGCTRPVFIRGMLDCLVRFDDGTFGVIDFKTSDASRSSALYSRQLHAYAAAIERPAPGSELVQGTVSDLGLVIYQPDAFTALAPTGAAMTGSLTYVNIPRDDDAFVAFLGSVMRIVEADDPPPPPKPTKKSWASVVTSCPYCQFLHDASAKRHLPQQ